MNSVAPVETDADAEAGARALSFSIRRFWLVFQDPELERELWQSHIRRGLDRHARWLLFFVMAQSAFNAVTTAFLSVDPTPLQIWANTVVFAGLAASWTWSMVAPAKWVRLISDPVRSRAAWATAAVVAIAGTTASGLEEVKRNRIDFADNEELRRAEDTIAIWSTSALCTLAMFAQALLPLAAFGDVVLVGLAGLGGVVAISLTAFDGGVTVSNTVFFTLVSSFTFIMVWVRSLQDRLSFVQQRRLLEDDVFVSLHFQRSHGNAVPPWMISANEIEMGETIGRGAFGEVLAARWRNSAVAIKRLLTDKRGQRAQFKREIEILLDLRHPNLLLLMAVAFQGEESVLIVLELAEYGSLADIIHRPRPGMEHALTQAVRLSLLAQAASGLAFLHGVPIVHRDFKPANVLVHANFVAKVCDFGLSSFHDKTQAAAPPLGTLLYSSPETLRGEDSGPHADTYSFALTAYEVLSGAMPWEAEIRAFPGPPAVFMMRIVEERLSLSASRCTMATPAIEELLPRAWEYVPGMRPPFDHVLAVFEQEAAGARQQTEAVESWELVRTTARSEGWHALGAVQLVFFARRGRDMLRGKVPVCARALEIFAQTVEDHRQIFEGLALSTKADSHIIGLADASAALACATAVVQALGAAIWPPSAGLFWQSVAVGIDACGNKENKYDMLGELRTEAVLAPGTMLVHARARALVDGLPQASLDKALQRVGEGEFRFRMAVADAPKGRGSVVIGVGEMKHTVAAALDRDELDLGREVRGGRMGVLVDATLSGKPVSVRRLPSGPRAVVALMRGIEELDIRLTQHKHIVAVLGFVLREEDVMVVTERVHASLADLCENGVPAPRALRIVADAARGLCHLHGHGIAHGAVSAQAVVASADGLVGLITDVGLWHRSAEMATELTQTVSASPAFLAPEVLRGDVDASPDADVFALGMVAVEAATGQPPHANKRWQDVVAEVRRGLPFVVPATVPRWLAPVVARAVHPDPERRPAAEQVVDDLDRGLGPSGP